MSEVNSVIKRQRIHNAEHMAFCYPTYKDMLDNNIVFAFRGIVTPDLVTHVLEIVQEKLEEQKLDRRFTKKLSNVMVECLTNTYADEVLLANEDFDPNAMLMVLKQEDTYSVVTGSYIEHSRVNHVKQLIEKLNAMTQEELKTTYHEILNRDMAIVTGPTDLSIVDLARKSKNKLGCTFKFVNDQFTFFALESHITNA